MSQFTASNGLSVKRYPDRMSVVDQMGVGGLTSFQISGLLADALREFFQHERDARLGRWRWPEDPDYVVYRSDLGAVPMHEPDGFSLLLTRKQIEAAPDAVNPAWQAARAYFDAHPESKPWHDAKLGEVWLLTFEGFEGDEAPWVVRTANGQAIGAAEFVYPQNGNAIALTDPEIIRARRIWPEATP